MQSNVKTRDFWLEVKKEIIAELRYLKFNFSWLTNRAITTDVITVSMTKKCNLNCTYCWDYDNRENIQEMKTEDIFKIIDSTKKMGAKVFNVLGGEPFVRKDTVEIIQYALNADLNVTVTTNGTLITEEKCEAIVKNAAFGRLTFHVSLDGHNEEENDYVRNRGSFKKTIKVIEAIQKYRALYKTGVGLIINTVISRNNYKSMMKQLILCRELKADCVCYITPTIAADEVRFGMERRKLIIQEKEFAELDLSIDELMKEKLKNPKDILNNCESLSQFKMFYRRQLEAQEKYFNNYGVTPENFDQKEVAMLKENQERLKQYRIPTA